MKTKTRKKFRIYSRPIAHPLLEQRQALIGDYVASSLKTFLTGERHRNCVTCGVPFRPKQRYHFNCSSQCLKIWSAGMLRTGSK